MKEDAFDDSCSVWSLIESELLANVPLRDVKWKSSVSSSPVTISHLPLRFLPATASLFKDTDHPFRWFLAPYVNMYLISGVESLDAYRAIKPKLKAWVDGFSGVRRESWVLVYLPRGNPSITYDYYQKVFARLCADFYADRPGDRCVFVLHKQFECGKGAASSSGGLIASLYSGSSSTSGQASQAHQAILAAQSNQARVGISELMSKLRDGVIASFEYRCILYDTEIRKLDTYRGTNQLDFKQLFLVKESLSLMYQMLSLYNEALVQLRELEVLLTYIPIVPTGNANNQPLAESTYPILNNALGGSQQPSDSASVISGGAGVTRTSSQTVPPLGLPPAPPTPSGGNFSKWRESWTDASKYGEEVLLYSINSVRMRVLKNKIGLLELYRYLFARIAYFLTLIGKPGLVVEKSLVFISFMRNALEKKFVAEESAPALPPVASESSSSPALSTSPATEGQILNNELLKRLNSTSGDPGADGAAATYPSRQALADVWVVTAAVKVTQYTLTNFAEETHRVLQLHENQAVAVEDRPPFPSQVETSRQVVALLYFALNRLLNILLPHAPPAATAVDAEGASPKSARPNSLLVAIWQRAMHMTAAYTGWDSLVTVRAAYPFAFPGLKLDRERKCSRFISASASAATVAENLEDSVSAYPQKLRHMLRATLYAMSGTSSSRRASFALIDSVVDSAANADALTSSVGNSRGVVTAQQCQFDALLLLISYIAIHAMLAERPRFAVMSLAKCIDIQIIMGNFSYAKEMLVKLLFLDSPHDTYASGGEDGSVGVKASGDGNGRGNLSTEYHHQKLSRATKAVNFILEQTSSVSLVYQPKSKSNDDDGDDGESTDFSLMYNVLLTWPKLRYWMLRKLLLVCRILATENAKSYPSNMEAESSVPDGAAVATGRTAVPFSATEAHSVLYMKTCLQLLELGLESDDWGEVSAADSLDDGCELPDPETDKITFHHNIFADLLRLSSVAGAVEEPSELPGRTCSSPATSSSVSSSSACAPPGSDGQAITSPFLPYFKMSIPMQQWCSTETEERATASPRLTQDRRLLLDEKYAVSLVNYPIESGRDEGAGAGSGASASQRTFELHLECFFPAEVVVEECYIRFQHFSIPPHSSHYHMDEVDLMGGKDRSLDDEDFGEEASVLKSSATALGGLPRGSSFRTASGGDLSNKFGLSRNSSRSNRDLGLSVNTMDPTGADSRGSIPSPPMSVNSPNLRLKSFYELLPPYNPKDPEQAGAPERQVSFSSSTISSGAQAAADAGVDADVGGADEDAEQVAPMSRLPSDGSRDDGWPGGLDNCTIPPFFDCHPVCMLSENGTRQPLLLRPGKQTIPFRFQANTVGEFIPCEINLRVGGRLIFHQPLEANHNQLASYFRENTVFSVQPPADVVDVRMETPSFTPVGQCDEALFHLLTRPDERINELRVYVYSDEEDSGASSASESAMDFSGGGVFDEMIARSRLLEEQAAAESRPRHRVDVAPSGEWQVFLGKVPASEAVGLRPKHAPATFGTTIQDLVLDSDLLLQDNPGHRIHYDYCDDGNGFSLTHLGDNRQLSLSIPFTTFDRKAGSQNGGSAPPVAEASACKINFTVTGTMIREHVAGSGRCVIPFTCTRSGSVTTGECWTFVDLTSDQLQSQVSPTAVGSMSQLPDSSGPSCAVSSEYNYRRQELSLSVHGLSSLELLEQKVVEKIRNEQFWESNKLPSEPTSLHSSPAPPPAVVLLRVKETRLVQCTLKNTSPIDMYLFGYRMHLHPGVASSTVSRSFRRSKTEVTVQHDIAGYTSSYASATEGSGTDSASPILACVSSYCIADGPDEMLAQMKVHGAGPTDASLVITPGEEYSAVFTVTRTTVIAGVSTAAVEAKSLSSQPSTAGSSAVTSPNNRRAGVRLSSRDNDFASTALSGAAPVMAYARKLLPFPPVLRTADGYAVKDCLGVIFEYRRHAMKCAASGKAGPSSCFISPVAIPLSLTAYNFSPPLGASESGLGRWRIINFSLPELFQGLLFRLFDGLSVRVTICEDPVSAGGMVHAGDVLRVKYTVLAPSAEALRALRSAVGVFDGTAVRVYGGATTADYVKLLLTPLATLQFTPVGKVARACSLPRPAGETGIGDLTVAEITTQLLCSCSGHCSIPPLQVIAFPTSTEGYTREQGLSRGQSLAQAQTMQPIRTIRSTSVVLYPRDEVGGGASRVCVSPHSVVHSSTMSQLELF